MGKETIKQKPHEELAIKNEVSVEGLNVEPNIFRHLDSDDRKENFI